MYIYRKRLYNISKGGENMVKTRSEINMEYAKRSLKRIPLDVQKDQYEIIKNHAKEQGETVNGFIKRAINETMERDKEERGTEWKD